MTVQNLHDWVFQPKWTHRPTWFPREMTLWGGFFWLSSCCCCFVGSSDQYIYWSHCRHFYNQKYDKKQKRGNFLQVCAIFIISFLPWPFLIWKGTSTQWNSSAIQAMSLPPLLTAVMGTFLQVSQCLKSWDCVFQWDLKVISIAFCRHIPLLP